MPGYASLKAEMQLFYVLKSSVWISALCLCAYGQTTTPGTVAAAGESKGLPPRISPAEYQAHAQAGTVTIAAEFTGHSIATPQGNTLSTEDYVVVETGFFGADGARLKVSADDFSLRINGKKVPLPSQPFGRMASSLKDPEWEPPAEKKSKGGMSTGGGGQGGQNDPPPTPPKMPFPERRAMEQRVQKALLPEGDRALPVAGLIFFQYGGKTKGMKSLELIYEGPAGKATLKLQP
jgi:hypothetical protein